MPIRVATLFPNIHVIGPVVRMMNFAKAVDPDVVQYELIVISRSGARDQVFGSLRQQCADARIKIVDMEMSAWDDRLVRLHPLAFFPGLWKVLRTIWRLARTLRREKIDVVECHGHV